MCQGNYDLDSDDDDYVIDIPLSDDSLAPQQRHHQLAGEEGEGLFDNIFNEDSRIWLRHMDGLFNRISQLRFGGTERDDDDLEDQLLPNRADDGDAVQEQRSNSLQEAVSGITEGGNRTVAEIMEAKDLKMLRELGGAERVASILGSDLVVGKVAAGLQLAKLETTITVYQIPHFILKACRKETKMLLFFLAVITLEYGVVEEGPRTGWRIGAAILAFWLFRVAHPSASSFCAARKMEKTLNEENGLEVEVVRSGQSQVIRLCDLVEGDIVRLREGSPIPADGLLVDSNDIVLDGALDNKISRDQNPFLYYGSKVVRGQGNMLVTSTGANMELGKHMSWVTKLQDKDLLSRARHRKPNPYVNIGELSKEVQLEDQIDKPLVWLGNLALLTPIFSVVLKFLLFCFWKNSESNIAQTLKGAAGVDGAINLFKQMLNKGGKVYLLATLIPTLVFGLQHGIKIVISICLNYWNAERESSEVSPQNLSAYGTVGIVTVVCIDASAGLMCEKMEVSRVWIGQEGIDDNDRYEMSQAVSEALSCGVGGSALLPEILHSPTDDFLISWAKSKWAMNMEFLEQRFTVINYGKLSSNREGNGVLLRKNGSDENIMRLHWKGDAKTILDMCSQYYDHRGEVHSTEDQKSVFESVIKQMEDGGLRPIAFAYKQTEVLQLEEDGLILLALVGVKYQFQEEMKSVVKTFQKAGIRIKLVSEDELSTSRAMAYELGLFSPGSNDEILEGHEFRELTSDLRMGKVDQITVMGSSLAIDKLHMVKSLKQKGHVVGFIGGWTARDVPVLIEADVGITIGNWNSEMTKEISDIVLASDRSFSSLIPVFESGRLDYNKIQNFIRIQFISNVSALLITTVETICREESSITIVQFLYVNLVLAVLGGLMLLLKPQHKELRNNHPGKRSASIITNVMWLNIVLQVLYQVVVLLVFQLTGEALPIPGMSSEIKRAMIFNSFILCQVFNYFRPWSVADSFKFWLFLVLFTVLHVVGATELWVKMNRMQWAFCFIIAMLSWGVNLATLLISILIEWQVRSTSSPNRFSRLMPLPPIFHALSSNRSFLQSSSC